MATAGFILPKVNFLNITLDGGKDLLKTTNEPHIGDAVVINASDAASAPQKMQVDITLSIEVGFDQSSNNIYSMFFKNFDDILQAYLKIRVIQSAEMTISQEIRDNPFNYLKKGGIYDSNEQSLLDSGLVRVKKLQFDEYEGNGLDLDNNPLTNESSLIEKKYGPNGELKYIFPYKVTFEVPESVGGVKVNNLDYFAHAYIDVTEVYLDEGPFYDWVNLPSAIVENLSLGEVTDQTVIRGGTTKQFGQLFYITPLDEQGNPAPVISLDQLSVYTGPVHYHGPENPGPDGYIGYMAGVSGADMGPNLIYLTSQTIFNNILQDFREVVELEKISYNYSLFSNSWFNQQTTEKLYNNLSGIKQLANQDNQYAQDTDDIEKAIVKSFANSKDTSIFTEFYQAMDGSGNTRFVFGIDMVQVLKEHSAFPKLIEQIIDGNNEEDINNLLNKKIIKEMKIYRDRVYEQNPADPTVDLYEKVINENSKLICVSADSDSGVLQTNNLQDSQNEKLTVGTIREEPNMTLLVNNDSIKYKTRFFSGTDLQVPNDGCYTYSVELTFKDPIIGWMHDKIMQLEETLYGNSDADVDGFSQYAEFCGTKTSYYNAFTNRFTQEGIDAIKSEFGSNFHYNKIVEFFLVLSSFAFFNSSQIASLFNFLGAISGTGFGNPSGAIKVLNIMENAYKKILNVFASASKYKKPIDNPLVGADGKGQPVNLAAGSNPKREFIVKKKFDTKLIGDINHLTGYDYLSQNNTVEEDTQEILGLKRMGRDQFEQRTNLETQKLFANPDYNIEIPKKPLVYVDEDYGANQLIEIQGPIMNPNDSINFTKTSFLSPSIINFASAPSQNMLNGGNLRTDIKNLNNTLLNIIRTNVGNSQKYDLPILTPQNKVGTLGFATGVGGVSSVKDVQSFGDKIITKDYSSELKYDLLSIITGRQSTITALELNDSPSIGSTPHGVVVGGSTGGSRIQNLSAAEIGMYDLVGSGLPSPYAEKDIFVSNIDPSNLLLTVTLQNLFKIMSDTTWTWEYYVENFDETFFKEFFAYGLLKGLDELVDTNTDTVSESPPLKEAPNHLKSLMSNLDKTKPYTSPAFDDLLEQIKTQKPFLFTEVSNQEELLEAMPSLRNVGDTSGGAIPTYPSDYAISHPGFNEPIILSSRKIMYQTPEMLSFFMLNFKKLVKVEILTGYGLDSQGKININNPIWKQLTEDVYTQFLPSMGIGLCRLVPYKKDLYGIKQYEFMNLPIYNEYFFIDFSVLPQVTIPEDDAALDEGPSPFGDPDQDEFLPGGQTMEEVETLVGAEGGAFGISIQSGLDVGAVTELGMTGFIGGAAGGVDVGTGAGFGTGDFGDVIGGPLGGVGVGSTGGVLGGAGTGGFTGGGVLGGPLGGGGDDDPFGPFGTTGGLMGGRAGGTTGVGALGILGSGFAGTGGTDTGSGSGGILGILKKIADNTDSSGAQGENLNTSAASQGAFVEQSQQQGDGGGTTGAFALLAALGTGNNTY